MKNYIHINAVLTILWLVVLITTQINPTLILGKGDSQVYLIIISSSMVVMNTILFLNAYFKYKEEMQKKLIKELLKEKKPTESETEE